VIQLEHFSKLEIFDIFFGAIRQTSQLESYEFQQVALPFLPESLPLLLNIFI